MKKKLLLCLFLCSSFQTYPYKLNNSMLKNIDKAGFFDLAIIDIIKVRQKVKDLLHGKFIWQGAKINLKTDTNNSLTTIIKRPETIYGATFIVIPSTYKELFKFVLPEYVDEISNYIKRAKSVSLFYRQEHNELEGYFTGSYAYHPVTNEKLPIYVSDYAAESFDIRNACAHLATPGHINKDFMFAQKHLLPIKQVVGAQPQVLAYDLPVMTKDHKHLAQAYIKDDNEVIIINSDFLDGTPKAATEKIIAFLVDQKIGNEYKEPILYDLHDKKYSIDSLKTIEETLIKQHLELSTEQKETFNVLMNYAQADLLDIVEPFLSSIHTAKDLMIELIEGSCNLRNNNGCYMLIWSKLKSTDAERIIFKRDITNFYGLAKFCTDLVDFLGDFASSCPHALENLKRLKK